MRVCRQVRNVILTALLLAAWGTPEVTAQTPGSTRLAGLVRDAQGRPVPGATVILDPQGPGLERQVTTDAAGEFALLGLSPGLADVIVRASGFRDQRYPGLPLEVGQSTFLEVDLTLAGVQEQITVTGGVTALDTTGSVVDAVIGRREIEALPLNGRNFLELALLVPGNAPAPTFDPTKTNTVTISSAGQLGRGGNITIDGADNNDDVVGGALQNVTQEAVREFQIATNRFTAEAGRSASSVINIVTKSGGDELSGSASLYARDAAWQALPATFDHTSGAEGGDDPPFDRQQIAGAIGGPLLRDRAWWFGAAEYRNQDGAILVGTRDPSTRTIRRSFAPAPLDDLLITSRLDWKAGASDQVMARYALQREEDIAASAVERAIGSATQRQASRNRLHAIAGSWQRILSPASLNVLNASVSTFRNAIAPTASGPQLTFPSLQDGSSFRVPQATDQTRFQLADTWSIVRGAHMFRAGGEWQRVDGKFDLGVFQAGRIELVQDFPAFDHNGDGRVDDNDLLFAVTLRSGRPDRALVLDNCDNNYVAFFVQDDWRVRPDLTINAGLRYELDTNVKNISGKDDINPIVQSFLQGERRRDTSNWGPRIGFNWHPLRGRLSVHGGYGLYYDRVTLQIMSLERGLDGRALPIEVRAGSVMFVDQATGRFAPGAPTMANPFTGFILPGAGASGINIIDNTLQNPQVQQFNLGIEQALPAGVVLRIDGVHNLGTHFIIGRTLGAVFNPVVGGPDRVVNLESSARTKYDALLVSVEQRRARYAIRAGYAWSKAFNYANDDQIPFANGPIDPGNLRLEYGPTPNDQRHRLTVTATVDGPVGLQFATLATVASGVPMDILMPDGLSRIPVIQRNAGGRQFKSGAELNDFLRAQNDRGGIDGVPLPLVSDDVRFGDGFSSVDVRVSRRFDVGLKGTGKGAGRMQIEPMVEVFNLFNVTNILGATNLNYSGAANALVRDSDVPSEAGFLRSSSFGRPVSTAGGVFGSGGPRAVQVAVRATF
jgi:hypothetical protein